MPPCAPRLPSMRVRMRQRQARRRANGLRSLTVVLACAPVRLRMPPPPPPPPLHGDHLRCTPMVGGATCSCSRRATTPTSSTTATTTSPPQTPCTNCGTWAPAQPCRQTLLPRTHALPAGRGAACPPMRGRQTIAALLHVQVMCCFAGCHAPGNIAVARNRHTFVYKLDSDWYDIVPSTLSTCMCRNLLLMAACGGTAACAAPGLRMARATRRDRRHAPPVQISCA